MRDTLTNRADDAPSDGKDGATSPSAAPLIVAGRKGESGNAAFTISNASARDGSVTLTCRGDFGRMKVRPDPEKLDLKSGDAATLRVVAAFDGSVPVGEDRPGDVYVPELDRVVAEFVVRRLPDAPAAKKPASKAKAKKKKT